MRSVDGGCGRRGGGRDMAATGSENIITATMEELTEEEHKAYLLVEEHVKAQFLKGFKKDRGGLVKRVEEFVLPSLNLTRIRLKRSPM